MSGPFGLVDGASLVGLILIFIVAMTFITMIGNAIKFVSR
jgi:hypothetical protein